MTDGDADMRKDTMRSAPDPHLPDWADRLLSELHGIKEALGGLEIAVSTQATLIDAEDVDGLGILLRKRSGLIDSMAASSERVAPLIECFQREDAARMGRRAERIQRLMDEIRRSLDVVLAHDREAEESIAARKALHHHHTKAPSTSRTVPATLASRRAHGPHPPPSTPPRRPRHA